MDKSIVFILVFGFAFVLLIPGVLAQSSECEDDGYDCFDISCPGWEELPELNCPPLIGERPAVCCKEIIDLTVEPEIILNKQIFTKGDSIDVRFILPYFSDCEYYFVTPDGREKQEGGGGCSADSGFATSDVFARLEQLFGSVESGLYKIKIIARKEGYADIVSDKVFRIELPSPSIQKACVVDGGQGICEFLGMDYSVEASGCGKAGSVLEVDLSYDGIVESFDSDSNPSFGELGDFVLLRNGVEFKSTSSPCSVFRHGFLFRAAVPTECGNGLCEAGEDGSCSADCEVKEIEGSEISGDVSLECSVGCLYGSTCIEEGTRKGAEYCDGAFFTVQKENGASCSNDYECSTDFCDEGTCKSRSAISRFFDWLGGLFG